MHGAFVIFESGVECTRERLRTSGRCNHCKLPPSVVVVAPRLAGADTVRAEAGGQSHRRPSCHSLMAKRSLSPAHLPSASKCLLIPFFFSKGRSHASLLDNMSSSPLGDIYQSLAQQVHSYGQEQHITLAGKYAIIFSAQSSHFPSILVLSASNSKHIVHITPFGSQQLVRVTALAADQSSWTSANLHIAACLSNGDIYVHDLHSHPRKHYYAPFKTPRTASIIQDA